MPPIKELVADIAKERQQKKMALSTLRVEEQKIAAELDKHDVATVCNLLAHMKKIRNDIKRAKYMPDNYVIRCRECKSHVSTITEAIMLAHIRGESMIPPRRLREIEEELCSYHLSTKIDAEKRAATRARRALSSKIRIKELQKSISDGPIRIIPSSPDFATDMATIETANGKKYTVRFVDDKEE